MVSKVTELFGEANDFNGGGEEVGGVVEVGELSGLGNDGEAGGGDL